MTINKKRKRKEMGKKFSSKLFFDESLKDKFILIDVERNNSEFKGSRNLYRRQKIIKEIT